jgi:hypothetical protein
MSQSAAPGRPQNWTKSNIPDWLPVPDRAEENKTTAVPRWRTRHPKPLDAGPFAADVASFRLHLAAENKAGKTIELYTDAVRWFAACHLLRETGKTRWGQVDAQDVQRWTVRLLSQYSDAYTSNQYRALQQFFK